MTLKCATAELDRAKLIHSCKDDIFLLLTAVHEYRAKN